MWLSVLMEGSLIATCAGALIASTFGMNLSSGAQESSQVSFHFQVLGVPEGHHSCGGSKIICLAKADQITEVKQ